MSLPPRAELTVRRTRFLLFVSFWTFFLSGAYVFGA